MRQIDMARQLGITESLVTKIETGRAQAEPRIKDAIAKMLGIHTWEVP
jgi:ribosome-binding protein aMBF1 (putative translation factor)